MTYQAELRKWIEESDGCEEVKPSKRVHYRTGLKQTCKGRYLLVPGSDEVVAEIAFSLMSLMGAHDAVRSTVRRGIGDRRPVAVYAYNKENELVAILAGRTVGDECGEEKVRGAQKVPSRPRPEENQRPTSEV